MCPGARRACRSERSRRPRRTTKVFYDGQDDDARLDALAAQAAAAGVRAVVWRGKGETNCQRAAEMALLNEAGQPTAGLCRAEKTYEEIQATGNVERFTICTWWEQGLCAYQKMKEAAVQADIILLSHYWLTAHGLPTELKEARGIIVDESILFRVVQAAFLPFKAFETTRERPRMNAEERKDWAARRRAAGRNTESLQREAREFGYTQLRDRNVASGHAEEALKSGRDVASAFTDFEGGIALLDAAIRVCTDGLKPRGGIYPGLTFDDVQERCSDGTPPWLRMERRFWIIVRERAKSILADREIYRQNERLKQIWSRTRPGDEVTTREDLRPTPTLDAEGRPRRDVRLQRIHQPGIDGMVEGVRVSWRATPNWAGVPMLLLDASADEDIVRRIWPGRAVEVYSVPEEQAPLNLRTVLIADGTYSGSAMLPAAVADPDADRHMKALADVRKAGGCKLLDLAVMAHNGRGLFGASKAVREAMLRLMRPWPTLDSVHYGAQRGLDFAKDHAFAVSLGRSEMPIWLIDGLVAALTWDAEVPEEPYDKRGDGLTAEGKPLMRVARMRLVRMRDGRDLELVVPVMPGLYAAKVDFQWREEEIQQFRGRLRPMFRSAPATWVHVSSVMPERVVADEILTLCEAIALWSPVLATVPGMLGVVAPVETARLADVPVAEVEAYVAAHADDPSWRSLTWTEAGIERQGLLAAWVTDISVALGMSAIPDGATVGDLRAPMVPSGTRAPDAVELARPTGAALAAAEHGFAAAWAANSEGDRESARVGWVRERLDAPPPEPEDDDELPATDDIG